MSEQKKKPTKKPQQEKLSKKDLEELMGVNKSVYIRHNGAIRRK